MLGQWAYPVAKRAHNVAGIELSELLLYPTCVLYGLMSHRITESEQRRMEEFASTPKYRRGPHLLQPSSSSSSPSEDDAETSQ